MKCCPWSLAERFIGVEEIPGTDHNQQVLAMLRLDEEWPKADEVPWCSAFVNYIAWLLRLPRSKSLLARSWLKVGTPIQLHEAERGWDIVILSRGDSQPGPENLTAPGHVGFYTGHDANRVYILGGNQSDSVNVFGYSRSRLLGVRRLE